MAKRLLFSVSSQIGSRRLCCQSSNAGAGRLGDAHRALMPRAALQERLLAQIYHLNAVCGPTNRH